MGARNQVGIGLSYRPASLCSLATQFQTRFLESIPRPIAGLKIPTQNWERLQVNKTPVLNKNRFSITKVALSTFLVLLLDLNLPFLPSITCTIYPMQSPPPPHPLEPSFHPPPPLQRIPFRSLHFFGRDPLFNSKPFESVFVREYSSSQVEVKERF
jgi:hypothetical protein